MQASEHSSETEKPLTRVDVDDRVRRTNTSSALDFSGQTFENHIDLAGLNLGHARFVKARLIGAWFVRQDGSGASRLAGANFEGAQLEEAHFQGVYLGEANLRHADLDMANLREANLTHSDLRGANLTGADLSGTKVIGARLEGSYISGSDLNTAVGLEFVDWGNYWIGEEIDGTYGYPGEYVHERFLRAEPIYRSLRYWHMRAGVADRAAKFYYREMECKKKQAKRDKDWGEVTRLSTLHLLFGYGERPERTFLWAAGIVVIFAALLFTLGGLTCGTETSPSSCSGLDALYLSAVSFTALGYGGWAAMPNEFGRFVGVFESFLGVFTMALFVTLFVRKMAR